MPIERIEVEGLKELDKALAKLGDKLGLATLRKGLLQASTPMLKEAKANALKIKDSGATHAAMTRRGSSDKRKGRASVRIYPNGRSKRAINLWQKEHDLKEPPNALTHFHMIELGTKRSKAQPFIRPAFDAKSRVVLANFKGEVLKQIDKVAK